MPERRGGRRKLNVTGCKHVYKGTNSKGGEFNIYEVTAVAEAGQEIRDKLTSFVELPMGLREYEVVPYEKNGVFQSWTLSVPKEHGGNSAAAQAAVARRIEYLEQQVEWLTGKVNSLDEALQSMLRTTQHQPAPRPAEPATPVGTTGGVLYQGHDPDDVPF
jgi:hypothetical protein